MCLLPLRRRKREAMGLQGWSGSRTPPLSPSSRLPDPDALLRQVDRAIANVEYACASRHLSAIVSAPLAVSSPPHSLQSGEATNTSSGKLSTSSSHVEHNVNVSTRNLQTEMLSGLGAGNGDLHAMHKTPSETLREWWGNSDPPQEVKSSAPNVSNVNSNGIDDPENSAVDQSKGLDGSVERVDARAADLSYRAGSAALAVGDAGKALRHLLLASIRCPRDRPMALEKIQRLITAASQQLEMQEARSSRNGASTPLATTSQQQQQPGQKLASGELTQTLPMKVLAVGDMVAADEAYRAGVSALEGGDPATALKHLRKAAMACPAGRQAASSKIQALVEQALFELKL